MKAEGFRQISLEWNRDYGIDRRTGWTVVVNGRVGVQLEPSIFKALWRGWLFYREHMRWIHSEEV